MTSFLKTDDNMTEDSTVAELMEEKITVQPSFPKDIHILSPPPTLEQKKIISELKERLNDEELYQKFQDWANDLQLQRFLIARNYSIDASYKLIMEALEWRAKRKPHEILANMDEWNDLLANENETGKIYCPGFDQWGRSLVVFNNEMQNTKGQENHMSFLAWNLEFASSLLNEDVSDKYLIFCHLTDFSLWTAPAFAETLETIKMLTTCFPERLGHFICFQSPLYFKTVFHAVKGFLDQRTIDKLVFIQGDISDGSANDLLMKNIIGENWKVLSGACQPVLVPKCSPGFGHKTYWPTVHERIEIMKSRSSSQNTSQNSSLKMT
jgi:hypothetical protein